jgi:signal transduction histidine kinase
MNLLSKAVKFAKKGGITFKVGDQEANSGFTWKIDTGLAIAPEQLEAIFLPFQQVGEERQQTQGARLGWAISR